MNVCDAETGHEMLIDTGSETFRKAHQRYWNERQQVLKDTFNKSKVDWTSIATHQDYVKALMLLFAPRV